MRRKGNDAYNGICMNEKPHPDVAKETCIKCGASVIPGDQYCDSCGAKIETALSCKKCGAQLEPDVQFCDSCGAKIGEGKRAVPSEPSNQEPTPTTLPNIIQQEPPVSPSTQKKSPGLALIASFFIPGLGQIYNGKTAKGFAIFFGSLIGSLIFYIPGLIVWIYGMFDAYSTANKMNKGEIPFVPYKKVYIIILIIIWLAIVAIVLLFLYYFFTVFMPAYTGTINAKN